MFLENQVKQGEIHTLAFRKSNPDGSQTHHVVAIERNSKGNLFMYDPQRAIIMDVAEMNEYFKHCYEMNLFRCDNAILDVDIAKEVFRLGF